MDDHEPQRPAGPRLGAGAQTEAEQRRARQAAALRENLRRRKAQERQRTPSPDEGQHGPEASQKDP